MQTVLPVQHDPARRTAGAAPALEPNPGNSPENALEDSIDRMQLAIQAEGALECGGVQKVADAGIGGDPFAEAAIRFPGSHRTVPAPIGYGIVARRARLHQVE